MAGGYDGLRIFLKFRQEHGEIQVITGAGWDLEIGALSEAGLCRSKRR